MNVTATHTKNETVQSLELLVGPGNVAEIRILGVEGRNNRTDAGYFDDFEAAAAAIQPYCNDTKTKGIYVVLNQVDPALLARANNRIETWTKQTTSDRDILRRRWLYIDCDPTRPAGISATDTEKNLAVSRADDVRGWLMDHGLCEPISAMSGNGAHLQFPIDLPNDDESTALVKAILTATSDQFTDDAVSVDLSVFNAARICRLYGTPARKGDSTSDRPHRQSELLYVPDYIEAGTREVCSIEALKRVAALVKPADQTQSTPVSNGQHTGESRLMLPVYLRHHGIEHGDAITSGGWVKYQIDCVFDPNHKRPDAYVAQHDSGALVYHCSHNSCSQNRWAQFCDQYPPLPEHYDPPKVGRQYSATNGVDLNPLLNSCGVDDSSRNQSDFATSVGDSGLNPSVNGAIADKSKTVKIKRDTFESFPVDLLPDVLRKFVTESAAAIGCDPVMSLMPALGVCAAAIGTSRNLLVKHGWFVPSVIWPVVIGESGSQKSPPYRMAVEPLKARQTSQSEQYAAELTTYQEDLKQYKRDLKQWERNPEGSSPGEPARPTRPRCLVSDATLEALAPILSDNPRGVLLGRDELSGWIAGFDKYNKGGGTSSNVQGWLEVYNAGSIEVDRKTGDDKFISVAHAAVSVCGGIQPEILAKVLTSEHKANGLQSRLLMTYPPRQSKRWRDEEVSDSTLRAYHNAVAELFTLKPHTDGDGKQTPELLRLTTGAREIFKQFVNSHGAEQNAMHGHLASQWSKLEEIPARLAIILHCFRQVTTGVVDHFEVDDRTMSAAITLTEWFKSECLRITRLLTEPDEEREARHLIDWIRERGGQITARDLCKYRRDINSSEEAESKLVYLVSIRAGYWEDTHKSRVFILHSELSAIGA
jgi:hypothetical protein